MTRKTNREIRLKERPEGVPTREVFELVETAIPEPKAGEILVRNIWMSVDPYMRGRMRDVPSYVDPFQIGKALEGGCVGQVVASNNKDFSKGDYVLSMLGWREYWTSDGRGVTPLDPSIAPIQAFLGALGMPGLTAYVGLLKIAELHKRETVLVSAAAGAVGSVACQIAKAMDCRGIGSAGSEQKIAWLRDECGVDVAINYKESGSISAELRKACPEGIDVYFENVGGKLLDAALPHMKDFGRIAVCGLISQYNATSPPAGPGNFAMILLKRLRVQGFIVSDHMDLIESFLASMSAWIAEGKMKWKETVVEGIENAPAAFLGLFQGDNLGKMLVKIGPDGVRY
jgi:NADPH-dependent curcumin reductase CurA